MRRINLEEKEVETIRKERGRERSKKKRYQG